MSFVASTYAPPPGPDPFRRPQPAWHPAAIAAAEQVVAAHRAAAAGPLPIDIAFLKRAHAAHAAHVAAAKTQRRVRAAAAHCWRGGMGDFFNLNMFGPPAPTPNRAPVKSSSGSSPSQGAFINTNLFAADTANALAQMTAPSASSSASAASPYSPPSPPPSSASWWSSAAGIGKLTNGNVVEIGGGFVLLMVLLGTLRRKI